MPTISVEATLLSFASVAFLGLLTILLRAFVRSRHGLPVRPITGYTTAPRVQGRSIETGQSLHISLGTSGIGGADTAAALAGLTFLQAISDEAVACDSPPLITTSEPTTLILAQDALRRSYVRQHNLQGYDPRSVRFVAAAPIPYAAAVMDTLAHEDISSNIMVGAYGTEAALIVEEGACQGLTQIVGTSDVTSLSLLYPSTDHLLVGEEMFVAGAYIGPEVAHLSSLVAQDFFRWVMVVAILVSALLGLLRV